MAHSDSHTHSHSHNPGGEFSRAFKVGIALNTLYILVEAFYGFTINSMALIADAGHNLSDVLGLLLAWGAAYLAKRSPSQYKTYGMRKSTILAALFNGIFLFIAVGAISIEAIRKFIAPAPVEGSVMTIVAGIGVIINAVTAYFFFSGRKHDLNIKGAYMHMAADAGVSLGVVAAGILISYTSWLWIDPVISLVIVIVITIGTWSLLKDSFNLSMDAVPKSIETQEVRAYLENLPGVLSVHDLHIWGMSTTETALTVHLVKADEKIDNKLTSQICRHLHDNFGIEHTTIQLEEKNTIHLCKHQKI